MESIRQPDPNRGKIEKWRIAHFEDFLQGIKHAGNSELAYLFLSFNSERTSRENTADLIKIIENGEDNYDGHVSYFALRASIESTELLRTEEKNALVDDIIGKSDAMVLNSLCSIARWIGIEPRMAEIEARIASLSSSNSDA